MRWLGLCALVLVGWGAPARAAPPKREQSPLGAPTLSPSAPAIRQHYYELLARSPTKALLWELALPGAGHVYAGFHVQAVVSMSLSAAGAGLWIAGALRDNEQLWWTGMATFAAGRAYGLISAPLSAALLNAAFRRQLGISARF
jgi:hypothetical protein